LVNAKGNGFMIRAKESDCAYSVFDSIEYICDKCKKTNLKVTSMSDLDEFEEIFDIEAGYEDELICFKCSNSDKKYIEEEL
jgi:hypothetical protein